MHYAQKYFIHIIYISHQKKSNLAKQPAKSWPDTPLDNPMHAKWRQIKAAKLFTTLTGG